MINVKDIPQDLLDRIREQFNNDPRVQRMQVRQGMLQRNGRYAEALAMAKDLETLYNDIVFEYINEAERQSRKVSLESLGVSKDDAREMMTLCLVMFMCCDIIESANIDVNDIVKRYDKELSFDMFADIRQLKDMAKEKLRFLQANSGFMKGMVWADKCDNMYAMMLSKARAIQRKGKETAQ